MLEEAYNQVLREGTATDVFEIYAIGRRFQSDPSESRDGKI